MSPAEPSPEQTSLPSILVIGTGDTKFDELQFMAGIIRDAGAKPVMVDVSISVRSALLTWIIPGMILPNPREPRSRRSSPVATRIPPWH